MSADEALRPMSEAERKLLLETARVLLLVTTWGHNVGVSWRDRHELEKAVEAATNE